MSDPDYPVEAWRPTVEQLIATAYPRVLSPIAMKWLEDESGGNPCAFGDPPPIGTAPDGNPREIGLGQLYNPDDFKRLGISPSAFRAYCVPGTQKRSRKLTPDEMIAQVKYTVLEPIGWGMEKADAAVTAYGLDAWEPPDYWKLVKAPHALPGILQQGMPAVVKKLGRAPSGWLEFRQELGMDDPAIREKVKRKEQLTADEKVKWRWMRALDACEKIGNALLDPGAVA